MKYTLIQRINPNDLQAPRKWFASPYNQGTVTLDTLAKEIAGRSSLTKGDVKNVLENFLDLMPEKMADGKSVKLGGLGTFRISFSSSGSDRKEDFNVSHIRNTKVVFTAGTEVKAALAAISFEREG